MPKKKHTGLILGVLAAVIAVAVITFAVSYKMYNDNLKAQENTTEEPTGDAIADTDETFNAEKADIGDIFSGAVTVEITDETDYYLICLNRFTIIEEGLEPMMTRLEEGNEIFLENKAAAAYEKMYAAAKEAGVELTPIDGYTGFDRQNRRYSAKVNEFIDEGQPSAEAMLSASYFVLPAGHSEQHLGLVVWIGEAKESFKESDAYMWLRNHAAEYGFIERYPSGKESLTYINYMPWIWRYVGEENAKTIADSGLCLEEFVS